MLSYWLTRYVYQESALDTAEAEDRVRWAAGTIFSGTHIRKRRSHHADYNLNKLALIRQVQPDNSSIVVVDIREHLQSVASTRVFIMAMTMYPEVQAKAQAEIDAVIGTRLPEMADRDSLTYVQCIVKEVLRWRTVLPLGALRWDIVTLIMIADHRCLALPHACIQDDIYKGYRIPKGAIM
jgi:hypothetical protein